jgi:hypothetical protein
MKEDLLFYILLNLLFCHHVIYLIFFMVFIVACVDDTINPLAININHSYPIVEPKGFTFF